MLLCNNRQTKERESKRTNDLTRERAIVELANYFSELSAERTVRECVRLSVCVCVRFTVCSTVRLQLCVCVCVACGGASACVLLIVCVVVVVVPMVLLLLVRGQL